MTEKQLLSVKDVESIIGFKRTWIYESLAQGKFPEPIKVGNTKRWKLSSIKEWLESL